MKYLQISKQIAALGLAAFMFSSCDKATVTAPLGDAGQNLVTILQGGTPATIIKDPVDFVPTPTTLTKGVIDIRREVPTAAALAQTMTVTIKDDTAAVRAANAAYVQFPTNLYTLTLSDGVTKVGGQGGTFTVVFKPGEFAKQIYINIPDATQLDPSSLYALGFTITTADAGGKIATAKSVIVEVGAKNPWDGSYAVTGPMVDAVSPGLVQWNNSLAAITDPFCDAHGGAWNLYLITTGATQCVMYDNTIWGDFFHPIWASPGNSGYGSFALVVNFNASNNTISNVVNYYGQPSGNTRSAQLDPSGANAVQANKDILIKYFMIQTNQATGSNPRTTFDEKWEYVGSR
ncbi:MAG: DUF1735 domain-containing protein [Bacteroidetes bacterium]|nr:DUF1735 domain-containing protein [Bacteroidota bacterium]